MVLDLNKHVIDDDKSHFHSSGFAAVANGNRVGAVSNISFGRRRQIEQNRRVIESYNNSNIGNAHTGSFSKPLSINAPESSVPSQKSLVRPIN